MRILIVEDAADVSGAVCASLEKDGFACDVSETVADALASLFVYDYALVILDIGLPDGSGLDVLREMRRREQATPVLMLTASFAVDSRVNALDSGADDYLVKPFDMRELKARARALARRQHGRAVPTMSLGKLVFDPSEPSVSVNGKTLTMTRRELSLLHLLLQSSGRIVSKTYLFEGLFSSSDDDVALNAIELYVARLRKKLAGSGAKIVTHRGLGYAIEEDKDGQVAA